MAPFCEPSLVVSGLKEKVESLGVHGDRLFLGTGVGNLHIYNVDQDEDGRYKSSHVTTKSLGKKPVEQVGYIKDINSVVALADSAVTLYPFPDLVPPTPLPQSRKAFSFAVSSTVESVSADGKVHSFDDAGTANASGIPTLVTYLVVGSQRKLVVYSWRDGEAQEVKEAPLPHSARVITFIEPNVLCLAYTATEHVLFYLDTMSTTELTMPVNVPSSTSSGAYGMTALSGLGGYMSLGLAAKAKPMAVAVGDDVLIPKDSAGLFFGADGKATQSSLIWSAPPEDIAYVKPYVLSIQSAGSISASSLSASMSVPTGPTGFVQSPVLQIQSAITLQPVQYMILPTSASSPSSLRLLTPSPSAKSPAFAVSTPVDRSAAAAEGSTIWLLRMRAWGDQVDELVEEESYTEALALLDSIEEATLPDKMARRAIIRALNAVSQFKKGDFDGAMNAFIELDINPAKVVALYPESVSGRLQVPPERWIPLFGGPEPKPEVKREVKPDQPEKKGSHGRSSSVVRTPSPAGSVRSVRALRKGTMDTLISGVAGSPEKDDDRVSLRGQTKDKSKTADTFPRSVEALLRYLPDRRPRIGHALAALHITPSQSHQFPFLSETSVEDLLALPSVPLALLTPEQLTRFAQVVDTALFKAYLVVRPGLLGPLCSLDNWCEVAEVEEVLMEREKFSELVSLYKGKKMHGKALSLLRRLSEKETDVEDKIRPSVSYVQNLGPEYLDQIFEAARWIFQHNPDAAYDIFTAEIVELPRSKVADFLEEDLDSALCARYLEYLIEEREETSTLFHDRLAELYLDMAVNAQKKGDEGAYHQAYDKFLGFIQSSDIYRVDRLFGLLPSEDMFEARAILLGRLGKHVNALEIYVYRLADYIKAEEYCKSIYMPNSPMQDIFLSLLKIYLEPSPAAQQKIQQQPSLLRPALELISRQSPRLDTLETLRLLPPLVPAQDVRAFLFDAARAPVFDTKVVHEVRKGYSEQVGRRLMALQSRRVRVTDDRICPQCHKRLGTSVIAVHAPRGEVTHYQCREAFSNAKKHSEHTHAH